jgi:hypothetical protein
VKHALGVTFSDGILGEAASGKPSKNLSIHRDVCTLSGVVIEAGMSVVILYLTCCASTGVIVAISDRTITVEKGFKSALAMVILNIGLGWTIVKSTPGLGFIYQFYCVFPR